jgi:hypothetical protein
VVAAQVVAEEHHEHHERDRPQRDADENDAPVVRFERFRIGPAGRSSGASRHVATLERTAFWNAVPDIRA